MTDKDREAFEAWGKARYGWVNAPQVCNAWTAWQGSRDHYAPTLTERELRAIISDALRDDDSEGRILSRALEALRAAGVRFKEQA
jgi:hypothetical protein